MDKRCRYCGRTWSQFEKTLMLGCDKCYGEFAAELRPVLGRLQGRIVHVGKRPCVSNSDRELMFELKRLQAEKNRLMIDGRFSEAEQLTSAIEELRRELCKRGLI